MGVPIAYLKEELIKQKIEISDQKLKQLDRYADLLLEWNQKMNLTAIIEPKEIAIKHFLDSLVVLNYIRLPEQANMIDIGTGAGFPAIPLLIMRPDIHMTMLDSTKKRLTFLQAVLDELGLQAELLHARAEEAGQQAEYRERFDLVTARAVARMQTLAEYTLPFAKQGGMFLAMKGPDAEEELDEAKKAIHMLGGSIKQTDAYTLPDNQSRTLIQIKKISQTSAKYPRASAQIARKPL